MCGGDCTNARASRGGLMAAMLPFQDTNAPHNSEFVLAFNNTETSGQTHATLSTSNNHTLEVLREVPVFTMRIEKYGHLTNNHDLETSEPLFSFELSPQHNNNGVINFELPQKLDFGVSEVGIVGRQATLLSSSSSTGRNGGRMMDVVGKGVIGWN